MSEIPDYKVLKKLADACRKSGIKNFKGFGMEFTLTEEAPLSTYMIAKASKKSDSKLTDSSPESDKIETDSLTDEALLMWSSDIASDVTSGKS